MNDHTITEFRKNKIFKSYAFISIHSGVLASFLILTFSLAICFVVIYSYPVAYKLDLQHPTLFFVSTLCSFGFWSILLGGIIIHTFYRYGLIKSKDFFDYVDQNILDISEFRELEENSKIQPTGFFQTLTAGFLEVFAYVGYVYFGIFAFICRCFH